jgi:hypothetical protein
MSPIPRRLFLLPDALELLRGLFDGHELAADLVSLRQVLVSGFLSWVRFFTAPLRALSPLGLFTAMVASCLSDNARLRVFIPNQELEKRFRVF